MSEYIGQSRDTTTTAPAEGATDPLFGQLRDVLVRSLQRNLLTNQELLEAFRVMRTELERPLSCNDASCHRLSN